MDTYDKLEQLMLDKSYAMLSDAERAWVSQYTDELAYDLERQVLLDSQLLFDGAPKAPAYIQKELLQSFAQSHNTASTYSSIKLQYLAWAASLVLAFVLGQWMAPKGLTPEKGIIAKPQVIYQTKKDTIYLTKEVVRVQRVVDLKTIRDTVYIEKTLSIPYANNAHELMPIVPIDSSLFFQSASVKDNQDLYDILVEVY